VVALPAVIQAESFNRFFDTTPGNSGSASCGTTDVDEEVTSDPAGGGCNVGWTAPGEWLEYDVTVASASTFDLTLRLASADAGRTLHVEIDGTNVTGSVTAPSNGWQAFQDVVVPGIAVSAGAHVVRLVFETGDTNVNYFVFSTAIVQSPPPPPPPVCMPSTTTVPAASMTATVGGPVTGGWNVWSNGSISTTHLFVGGNTIVRVSAAGQEAASVWPHMIVSVGGQTIGDTFVSATSFTPYQFSFVAPAGTATVSVAFDNDFLSNTEDRNLLVASVEIDECF
jgi:hypothetical protein